MSEDKWNFNGANYTIFNDSLVLMMNFDNVSALGENDAHVVDVSEHETAITAYNEKLSKSIEKHIGLENKRLHILRFTKKNKKLSKERVNIFKMIKGLQEDYLKKGKIETRTYELKLASYNSRVSEIDEALATLEAKQDFKKGFGLFKLLKAPKREMLE